MLYCADRRCSNSGMPCANYCQHVFWSDYGVKKRLVIH